MKKWILGLITLISISSSTVFAVEPYFIVLNARLQYLTYLRGYEHFHIDNGTVKSHSPELSAEAVELFIRQGVGSMTPHSEGYKYRNCDKAYLMIKIKPEMVLPDGRIDQNAIVEMPWTNCLQR